ncbi:hypothetical protein RB195_026074 [Necator americanus]|uniref:Uncharacterized protein n=1 Tax=Necator americanus TaxID=51031 RepID=A0ABR1EVI1_NECAM
MGGLSHRSANRWDGASVRETGLQNGPRVGGAFQKPPAWAGQLIGPRTGGTEHQSAERDCRMARERVVCHRPAERDFRVACGCGNVPSARGMSPIRRYGTSISEISNMMLRHCEHRGVGTNSLVKAPEPFMKRSID